MATDHWKDQRLNTGVYLVITFSFTIWIRKYKGCCLHVSIVSLCTAFYWTNIHRYLDVIYVLISSKFLSRFRGDISTEIDIKYLKWLHFRNLQIRAFSQICWLLTAVGKNLPWCSFKNILLLLYQDRRVFLLDFPIFKTYFLDNSRMISLRHTLSLIN